MYDTIDTTCNYFILLFWILDTVLYCTLAPLLCSKEFERQFQFQFQLFVLFENFILELISIPLSYFGMNQSLSHSPHQLRG